MLVINTVFYHFSKVSIEELFRLDGVYVISDFLSDRPVYVGEGNLLKRLSEHQSKLRITSWTGVCAIITGSKKIKKEDQRILEGAIIDCLRDTGRSPKNKVSTSVKFLKEIISANGKIRINIKGADPVLGPNHSKINGKKTIEYEIKKGEVFLSHPWRNKG